MSCLGLDVGNEYCRIGITRQGGIDVVLNEESKRETPAMVTFGDKQRFIGSAAAASALMNLRNTVWQIKRLIGRKFHDPEVQKDLKLWSCTVTAGDDGTPVIHVTYLREHRTFKPTELLGMILANLKAIASKNSGMALSDCVIGIPAFMNDIQRRAYLDAAVIAGFRPLRLMHETTAAALSYGIYKTDLPENDHIYVVFVDIGHAHTQVAVAAFRKGQLKVLAYAFDRCLGGRDFDEVLFTHFSAKFSAQYKIDILSNARACQRLRVACEKLKKILSANAEAPINIECLMDEKDVKGHMTREEFEKLAAPLLQRIRHPCEKALAESGVAVNKIYGVEVIGSGSRIPAISRVLTSLFKKEPSRTLNASECIARGCALQSAMLSPTFKVRHFEVQDYFLFPVALSWAGPPASEDGHEETAIPSNSTILPKGAAFPNSKLLTFCTTGPTFSISALYGDMSELPPSTSVTFATFTVGPFSSTKPEKTRLKVAIYLNLHGVLTAPSATLIEDEEVGVSPTEMIPGDAQMQDVDQAGSPKESTRKRRLRHTEVRVVEAPTRELSQSELQNAIEKEFEMELQDRVTEETKEVKNALEAFVYEMRNKFYGKLQVYASDAEKNELLKKIQETEAWLYEEGDDETKGVYSSKLADLRKHVALLEERQREEQARAFALTELLNSINNHRSAAQSKYDHIDRSQLEKVVTECNEAEQWARDAKHHQDHLPKYAKPAVWSSDIKNKTDFLDRYCKSILNGDRAPC